MKLLSKTLDWIYPRFCVACGNPAEGDDMHVCWDCHAALHVIADPYCRVCGDPADGKVDHAFTCSWCSRTKVAFDLARSAGRYRGALRRMLQALKYEDAVQVTRDLGRMLKATVDAHFADVLFDGVVSVPLHRRRERARSYNQSALLAHALAGALDIACYRRFLIRVRDTPSQTELNARQRANNVRGAFASPLPQWVEGRRLLLVDDVMTTGATVNECSRVLKQAGAAAVYVVTVARG